MKSLMKVFAVTALVIGMFGASKNAWAEERRGLGDLGFDPVEYATAVKHYPPRYKEALPSAFDWRDYGVVTPVKDQGYCGSCWAFACVGVMESKIILSGGPVYDLSEQQQVSCNMGMWGCCGGSYSALQYWYANTPWEELCTGYGDYTTGCGSPEVVCGTLSCSDVPYYSASMFTVNTGNVSDVRTSIHEDGPAYFRYTVYSDFFTYWFSASPGAVYTQTSGSYEGGHAVLIIGWDNSKGAWLCKNSWGVTGGPNNDGTFWMAWTGHANGLSFGMANIELITPVLSDVELVSPSNETTLGSPPTFTWTANGGANNAYAVDFALSLSGPVYSTYENLREIIYDTSWPMPASIWNLIPSGSYVYWRVRAADLDDYPLTIIASGEIRWFYKY